MATIVINGTVDRFRMLHSEIIVYYQCIEYDMRRIYSAMCSDDFEDSMYELSDKNWGVILNRLKKLDNSDGDPYFTKAEYDLLDEIRSRRNYWCHQCYLDWVYIRNDWEREERLRRLTSQLENEKNRTYKIHRKMQEYYLNDFT